MGDDDADEVFECSIVELFEEVAKNSKMMGLKVGEVFIVSEGWLGVT